MVTILTGKAAEVYAQLRAADCAQYLTGVEQYGEAINGSCSPLLFLALIRDANFEHLGFSPMHGGAGRDEFRSIRGRFGKGSLQIVIERQTGAFYADLDRWNPLQDVVGFVAHNVGEVFWPWVKGLFQKRDSA